MVQDVCGVKTKSSAVADRPCDAVSLKNFPKF